MHVGVPPSADPLMDIDTDQQALPHEEVMNKNSGSNPSSSKVEKGNLSRRKKRKKKKPIPHVLPLFAQDAAHVIFRGNEMLLENE
jgi:hypothetical protein